MKELKILESKWFVVGELVLLYSIPFLPLFETTAFYLRPLVIFLLCFFLLRMRGKGLASLGLSWSNLTGKAILIGSVLGITFAFTQNWGIEPLVRELVGERIDLSIFEFIKGNTPAYFELLAIGLLVGGFFEEFYYRGYLITRFGDMINHRVVALIIAVLIGSTLFAFGHSYQGTLGIVINFYFAILNAVVFIAFKRNLWYAVFFHGMYDAVGITALYLGTY